MIGNGYCNDESNNADCNYDGGDCCGTCVNTNHCSECECLGGDTGVGANVLIGNGICNDETNNETCSFDGGDCCLSIPNKDHCSECLCATTGIITSPGYPGDYTNNLDMSWIIKVHIGQQIEITFISFDVEYNLDCA